MMIFNGRNEIKNRTGRVMYSWRCYLSRLVRVSVRRVRLCPHNRQGKPCGPLGQLWSYGKVIFNSLYFNILTNWDTFLDSIFEPIYWLVDNLTRWFGVVFVCLVIALTSSVVVIVYTCVLPLIIRTYPTHWILWHVCYGHWNLMNIVFHYYKAITTSPGRSPQEKSDIPTVTICKKCIVPKPARTHHCSICDTCVLKMDHHCPWLNNCVGHFNHRYFFSFCLYMIMGCIYCSISAKDMFFDAYNAIESYYQTPPPHFTSEEKFFHKSLLYLWVLTSSVAVALGGLTMWHAVLITRGETSVERHINRKERKRLKQIVKMFTVVDDIKKKVEKPKQIKPVTAYPAQGLGGCRAARVQESISLRKNKQLENPFWGGENESLDNAGTVTLRPSSSWRRANMGLSSTRTRGHGHHLKV